MADDELLNRARMLSAAANNIAAQQIKISANVDINSPASPGSSSTSSPQRKGDGAGAPPSFKGAAIHGSSLLTTFSDMRSWCPRGSSLLIDGIQCTVSETGEHSSTRLHLTKDFSGPTNLEATLVPTANEQSIKTVKIKKSIRPVDSTDIKDAVKGLEGFTTKELHQRLNPLSPRDDENGKIVPQPRPSKLKRFPRRNISLGNMEQVQPINQASSLPSSTTDDGILRCQSAPQSNSNVKNSGSPQSRLPPLQSVKSNFGLGGGGRLIQPAAYMYEEIFERKNPVNVEQERIKIAERLAKKRKQDRLEKMKKEEEEKKLAEAIKARSDAKASRFLEKTMQRVEERKQKMIEKSVLAQEEARREEQRKAEKMAALATDMHAARVAAIRSETAKRLAALKKQAKNEEREREIMMSKKLAELERERGRAVPTSVILRGGKSVVENVEEMAHISLNLQLRDEDEEDGNYGSSNNHPMLGGEDDVADILEDVTDEYVNMREKYGIATHVTPTPPPSKIPTLSQGNLKSKNISGNFHPQSPQQEKPTMAFTSSSPTTSSHLQQGGNKNKKDDDDDDVSEDSVELSSQLSSLRRLKAMEKIEMATNFGPSSPTVSELTIGSPTFSRKSVSTNQTGKSGATKKSKKSFAPWKLAPLPTLPFNPIPIKSTR